MFQVMQQISGQEQKPAPTSLLRPLFLLLSADLFNVCFNHQTMFVFMVRRSSHKARPHDIGSSLPWWGRWVDRWRKLSVPQVLPKSGILPDFGTGNFLWRLLNFWTLCPTNAPLSWGKGGTRGTLNLNWQAGNAVHCLKNTQSDKGLRSAEC